MSFPHRLKYCGNYKRCILPIVQKTAEKKTQLLCFSGAWLLTNCFTSFYKSSPVHPKNALKIIMELSVTTKNLQLENCMSSEDYSRLVNHVAHSDGLNEVKRI